MLEGPSYGNFGAGSLPRPLESSRMRRPQSCGRCYLNLNFPIILKIKVKDRLLFERRLVSLNLGIKLLLQLSLNYFLSSCQGICICKVQKFRDFISCHTFFAPFPKFLKCEWFCFVLQNNNGTHLFP